jgi:outer membrane protein OmpA-like peptidoglycan-associated protein
MRLRLLILTIGVSRFSTAGCHKKAAMALHRRHHRLRLRVTCPATGETAAAGGRCHASAPPAPLAPAEPPHTQQTWGIISTDFLTHFDYNKAELRNDAQTALNKNPSELLSLANLNTRFVLEGIATNGSAEYNLALGDRRAMAAKEFLTQIGVPRPISLD